MSPPVATAARFRSRMRRQFGWLFYLTGMGVLLRRIGLEDHSAEAIRRAANRGPVVYILHTRSVLDWLALNRALNGRRLPLARFSNGMRSTIWAPTRVAMSEWWGATKDRLRHGPQPDPIGSGWLSNVVAAGMPTALFLLAGRSIKSALKGTRNRPEHFDPIPALLEAQTKCKEPIQVVPVVVAWQRRPEIARTQVGQFIMGSQDEPGPLQKLMAVAGRNAKAVVQAGQPFDLLEAIERFGDDSPARQERRIRLLLRRYLWRESHLIRGPRIRPYRWTQRLVLQSPQVRKMVVEESARTGKSEAEVNLQVHKTLNHIAARMRIGVVRMVALILKFLWNRIYAGVDIPDEDMARLRESFRDATPILIPCHRSHMDYLLMSSQLYYQDVVTPHIIAGENLSFWPLGSIFRRCGAFFIKRRFGEDRIFPVVFQRYLHQLVRDGFPIEFFIEGGRSRTGKLLPPRLGVLKMIMDSAQNLREGWDVNLVPIGISYEEVAEEGAYRRELQGEDKVTENMGQVVKASSIFGRRLGRVYLRIGEPIRLSETFAQLEAPFPDLDAPTREEVVQRTGEQIMHRIGQNMLVMPTGLTSLALLAQSKAGIKMDVLKERVQRLLAALKRVHTPAAHSLTHDTWSLKRTLERLERRRLIQRVDLGDDSVIQVTPDRRVTLEYYKNGVLHHIAPMSLMAAAIRAYRHKFTDDARVGFDHAAMADIQSLFANQVFWLRYDFTLDPNQDVETLGREALDQLSAYGAIHLDASGISIDRRERVVELAELTRNLLESSRLTLSGCRALKTRDLDARSMPAALQTLGETLLELGDIKRPEALSLVNLKNAVRALKEEGLLAFKTDGSGLSLDETTIREREAELNRLLN
jgi:glycerol-3-phosphate O-acyltransferase